MSAPEAVLCPVPQRSWASRQRLTLWVGAPFGLRTGLHASFPVAFLLLTFTLGDEVLPALVRESTPLVRLSLGATAALVLFLSVLAHELGHGLAARRLGMSVDGVVLFALGGLIAIDKGPNRPRDEAIVTGAGPLVSVLIAAGSAAGFALLRRSAPLPVLLVLLFLAMVNGLLAAFNLLPSLPLDGGRLLHSLLWQLLGSAKAASRWAGAIGVLFAAAIVVFGLQRLMGRGHFEAFWYVLTGLYLGWGALSEFRQSRAESPTDRHEEARETAPVRVPAPLRLGEGESERAA